MKSSSMLKQVKGLVCVRYVDRDMKWMRLVDYLIRKGEDSEVRELAGYFADLGLQLNFVTRPKKPVKKKQSRKKPASKESP